MILQRLRYPGGDAAFFSYSGALTPNVQRAPALRSVSSEGELPRFGRRIAGGRSPERFTLRWPMLTPDEVRLIMLDFEASARGVRRLSYTPDDQTPPVDVLVAGRPTIVRVGASHYVVEMALEVQA